MRLVSWGAAREVTGSNHMLEVADGVRLLVDCGMFQGHRREAEAKNKEFPYDPAGVAAVVLTHGHCDHCGRLPLLVARGFVGNIHCTPATRDIAGLIMADTAHIQVKDAEWLRKKNPGHPFEPLFGPEEVLTTLDHFVTVSYGREFLLPGNCRAQFVDAGHILGSAMTCIETADGRRIGFTGDIGRKGLPIIRAPQPLPDVDYLVCESTYGDRLHDPIEDAKRELGEVVRATVRRGGKIIIPAFAVERTQEVVYYLQQMIANGDIAPIDVFVDSPMACNATSIFRVHQECFEDDLREEYIARRTDPFGFEQLHYTRSVAESMALNERREPCVIISSSGMCEAGRILHHLKNNIGNPANTILIVGYMAANTLGRRIADREPEVRIFGKPYALKAQVKILNTFSAHADYRDIRAYVSGFDLERLREVILIHGESEAMDNLGEELRAAGVRSVRPAEPGEWAELS
jgi:metallo-beta-lactamase family protein